MAKRRVGLMISVYAYVAKRFNEAMPDYVTMTVTNRAYASPIWYSPGK